MRVASVDFVGEPLSAAHPNLEGLTDLKFERLRRPRRPRAWTSCSSACRTRSARTKVPELMATGARIVDLSGDFRLRDAAAYKRYYGADHPSRASSSTARSSTACPS